MFLETTFSVFIYDPISMTASLWCQYDNFYHIGITEAQRNSVIHKIIASKIAR